jgi:hypothetical protein
VRSRPFGKAANRSLTVSNVISSAASSPTFLKTPFHGTGNLKSILGIPTAILALVRMRGDGFTRSERE